MHFLCQDNSQADAELPVDVYRLQTISMFDSLYSKLSTVACSENQSELGRAKNPTLSVGLLILLLVYRNYSNELDEALVT